MGQEKTIAQKIVEKIYLDELGWPPSCIGVFYQMVRPQMDYCNLNEYTQNADYISSTASKTFLR